MVKKLLTRNLLRLKKVQSLFVRCDTNGKVSCNMVIVENYKSDFKITSSFKELPLEETIEKLEANIPIILTLDGKGIVHKKVDKKTNISVFHQALPNAKESDFYIQQYEIDESAAYISLARKEMIDKLLDVFQKKSMYVIGLCLGSFQLEIIAGYLDEQADNIIQGATINISDGKIKDIGVALGQPSKVNFQVSGELIEATYLVPFAGAVAFLSGSPCTFFTSAFPSLKAEEYQYKKFFLVGGWAMLVLFFTILLINFTLYTHFNTKLQATQTQLGQGEDILKKIKTLKMELDTRRKLSSSGNLSGNSSFSFYSDRLSACMPPQITLTEMKECPVSGRTKDNAEIIFEKDKIGIKGITPSSAYINQWIKSIEKEQWTGKVDIVLYKMDGEVSTGVFELNIQIISQDVH